jgi:hypothetical protein
MTFKGKDNFMTYDLVTINEKDLGRKVSWFVEIGLLFEYLLEKLRNMKKNISLAHVRAEN